MPAADASPPSVAIIGAGWAGLACALKLAQHGFKPVVYESAPEPGGRARRARLSLDDRSVWRDNGQHLMLAGCQALKSLLYDIHADVAYAPFAMSDGHRHLSLAGRRGQWGLLQALMQTRGYSYRERVSLLRALFSLIRAGWRVPPEQTVFQWLQAQHQPPALIAHFWAPLALAVLNTPLDIAAMTRLAPVLRDTLGAGASALEILQPRADLSDSVVTPWVTALEAAGGRVLCSQRVKSIEGGGATTTAKGLGQRYTLTMSAPDVTTPHDYDHVVLTLPPWALADIVLPFDSTPLATRFGAEPIATVYLGFSEDTQLPTPLVQLAGPETGDARVWAMDRRHCGEPGVISISLSADGPWTTLDHGALAERCESHLKKALNLRSASHWQRVVAVRRATPSATPSARLPRNEVSPLPGLWLAGDWTHPDYPATLEAAVATGQQTADRIMAIRAS